MLIVHRCGCGHTNAWHSEGMDGPYCHGPCGCTDPAYGAPEVIPSWHSPDGATGATVPDERVHTTCDCGACHTLATVHTGGNGGK